MCVCVCVCVDRSASTAAAATADGFICSFIHYGRSGTVFPESQ